MAGIGLVGAISGVGVDSDDTTNRALRVAPRPLGYSTFGHYHLAMTSGTIAAALAANAVVFSFRWGDSTRLAVVTRLFLRFQALTLFTPATLVDFGFDAYVGRSFSASHTGGTAAVITGDSMKKRQSTMGTTLLTDARISSTAALAGGTVTADGNAFAASLGDPQRVNPAAATEEQRVNDPTLDWTAQVDIGEHPLVLKQNEGILLRNRAVWPAAGTGIVQVEIRWAEVASY